MRWSGGLAGDRSRAAGLSTTPSLDGSEVVRGGRPRRRLMQRRDERSSGFGGGRSSDFHVALVSGGDDPQRPAGRQLCGGRPRHREHGIPVGGRGDRTGSAVGGRGGDFDDGATCRQEKVGGQSGRSFLGSGGHSFARSA